LANLREAYYKRAPRREPPWSVPNGADLSGAPLKGADLSGADLGEATAVDQTQLNGAPEIAIQWFLRASPGPRYGINRRMWCGNREVSRSRRSPQPLPTSSPGMLLQTRMPTIRHHPVAGAIGGPPQGVVQNPFARIVDRTRPRQVAALGIALPIFFRSSEAELTFLAGWKLNMPPGSPGQNPLHLLRRDAEPRRQLRLRDRRSHRRTARIQSCRSSALGVSE
jgi:hypothetical protein